MARGRVGSFGGKVLNAWWIWIAAQRRLLPRARRPAPAPLVAHGSTCSRCSPSGSRCWFFNRGRDLQERVARRRCRSRTSSSARRGSASAAAARNPALSWPVWLLAAARRLPRRPPDRPQPRDAAGRDRRRLRGRDRRRQDPRRPGAVRPHAGRGPRPRRAARPTRTATIRDRIQTNGRCESANARGDTYGPVAYLAYVPAVLALGWSGKWDSLPAAHATAIAFDLLVVLGLFLVGRRFGGHAARRSRSPSAGSRSRSPPTR